jgi:hypothetical protein
MIVQQVLDWMDHQANRMVCMRIRDKVKLTMTMTAMSHQKTGRILKESKAVKMSIGQGPVGVRPGLLLMVETLK